MGKPSPPSTPQISQVSGWSFFVTFNDGWDNGGSHITERRVGWSTDPHYIQNEVWSDRFTTIGDLTPGTTYYVWARTKNAWEWSDWSPRAQVYTPREPDAPSTPWFHDIQMNSLFANWHHNWDGGAHIQTYKLNWGTDPEDLDQFSGDVWSPHKILSLEPGTVYYIRVQAKNSVGWGAWSNAGVVRTKAGAWVNDAGVWRQAVPYVKDGGVWRLAEAWVNDHGHWRQTN